MGKAVDHKERAHALLSCSSSGRWLNCTAAPLLEDKYPNTSSAAADEGTLAHELCEIKLRSRVNLIRKIKETKEQTAERRRKTAEIHASQYYSEEMETNTDVYVDYILGLYSELLKRDASTVILIETKADLTTYVPEGFGANDCVIIGGGVMHVIDYKNGQGVAVYARGNSQLSLYALGALEAYGFLYDVDKVGLHIVQPKLDSISSHEIAADELTKWGEEVVKPKAEEAFNGPGVQVPGKWCQFCRARLECKASHDLAVEVAKKDFDTEVDVDANLLEVYKLRDVIKGYLSTVEAHILNTALAGKKWNGFKLVEGRSTRKLNAEKALEVLRENGYTDDELLRASIRPMGEIEKLLGKKGFETLLGPYVTKPPGAPTLVSSDDKRAEIRTVETARELFEDLDDDGEI